MHHNPRFLALVDGIRSRITETDVHQIKRWQDEGRTFHLIDVREESEWARGHLPGARYLGRGVIERDIETQFPDLETELYLYCGDGLSQGDQRRRRVSRLVRCRIPCRILIYLR